MLTVLRDTARASMQYNLIAGQLPDKPYQSYDSCIDCKGSPYQPGEYSGRLLTLIEAI